jgi:hypothetical protein
MVTKLLCHCTSMCYRVASLELRYVIKVRVEAREFRRKQGRLAAAGNGRHAYTPTNGRSHPCSTDQTCTSQQTLQLPDLEPDLVFMVNTILVREEHR